MKSSCRKFDIVASQFLHFQQPSTSLSSLSCFFNRRIILSQKISATWARLPPLFRTPPLRCAIHDDEVAGVITKDVEADPSLAVKDKAAKISPTLKGTSIFLLGMNSAIKTNLGKALADALRYYYFDSDSLVEQAGADEFTTRSFRERDEKGFMETETEVLRQLSSMGRLVVCTGDGAVQSSTNLALLRYGISIWIDIPIDMVAKEVTESESQYPPGYDTTSDIAKVLAQLNDQYERVRGGYETADTTVSIQKIACQLGYDRLDAVTVEDMAIEILKEIDRLTKVKKMMEEAARPF